MIDIFLSYRRNTGTEYCSFLYQTLKSVGYEVFFDCNSMRQGAFDKQIEKAITECTFLLVVLAPHDLDKCVTEPDTDWILHEVGLARELGKIIIPITFKRNFEFPNNYENNAALLFLSKEQICDLSGPDAAILIKTKLFDFMKDSPATKLRDEYNSGLLNEEYQKWEVETLQQIYNDCDMVKLCGKTYPVVVYESSEKVKYPFDILNDNNNLLDISQPLDYQNTAWYHDFKRIVGPNIHYPDLYGFANEGITLDEHGKVESFKARPRTYKETVYTSHILHYELWKTFQTLDHKVPSTLDFFPMRKQIHDGKTNSEVLLSGCNRSCLCDVCVAIIAYDDIDKDYDIAVATRSTNVACHPGYLGIVPSGGFELYELETKQDNYNIHKNFKIISALFREYIEEIFGDECFSKPTGDDDLKRLYRNNHIKDIRKCIGKTYFFEFLGITVDLTSLRPTFSFVLRIDDPNFLYENQIKKNNENVDLRFISLSSFEEMVKENKKTSPLLPESAGVYSLLKKNHLFQEIIDKDI